jgi:hypothetical protein
MRTSIAAEYVPNYYQNTCLKIIIDALASGSAFFNRRPGRQIKSESSNKCRHCDRRRDACQRNEFTEQDAGHQECENDDSKRTYASAIMVATNKSSGSFLNRPRGRESARANHRPRSVRFEMDVRRRRCLGAPRFIHCGYYQRSSRKIAFVWIAVQVTKHHVCFLKARDPRRRAARIRSLAGELPAEIDGVRNPSDISDAQRIARPGGIMWLAPSHKRVAIDEITVGVLSARLHGGSA